MAEDAPCLDRNSRLTAAEVPHPCPRGDAPHYAIFCHEAGLWAVLVIREVALADGDIRPS